jgi:hypothetical protein
LNLFYEVARPDGAHELRLAEVSPGLLDHDFPGAPEMEKV